MAHEISIRQNGTAEMAFVGDTPWHGLGQQLTKGASIGVWAKEAGMDWSAESAPAMFDLGSAMNAPDLRAVPGYKVLYRSDSKEALSVVGEKYNVVQPRECLEFFRDEVESGGWYIHTAGVLRGGRKLWAMATNGQIDSVVSGRKGSKGDQVVRQVLVATSLDGSMKTIVKPCATVVVCANTLAMALREGGKIVTVSHRSIFDHGAVKRALGMTTDSFDLFINKARELADMPIQLDEALDALNKVFGVRESAKPKAEKLDLSWLGDLSKLSDEVATEEDEDAPKVARAVGRCLELFNGDAIGADRLGREGTKWGLLNAVTEFVDHEMGRSLDTRMDSAWFGRGERIKSDAFEVLTAEEV